MTAMAALMVRSVAAHERQTTQQAWADELTSSVRSRFEVYDHVLRMLRGYYEGSEYVSIKEFRRFAEVVDTRRLGSGALGLGYVARVPQEERESFIERMNSEGFEDYRVWSSHGEIPDDADLLILATVEPRELNRHAIGAEVSEHPNVTEALERSAMSGRACFTEPLRLLQRREHWGAVSYMPLYHGGRTPADVNARDDALYGWVSVVVSLTDMMNELTLHRAEGEDYALSQRTDAGSQIVYGTYWDDAAEGIVDGEARLRVVAGERR